MLKVTDNFLRPWILENLSFFELLQKQALSPIFYLAGSYSGASKEHERANVRVMEAYHFALTQAHIFTVATPLMTECYNYMDVLQKKSESFWLDYCYRIILRSSGVLVLPKAESSIGVKKETDVARQNEIPVFNVPELPRIFLLQTLDHLKVVRGR